MTSTSPIVSCTILLEITSSPAQLSLLSAAIMNVIQRSPAVEYTLRSLSSGEEPLFPKLELLGLLDMLGTCDPDMPNLAGMLLWLRQWEQTAPAARSCVLFIGDCGDRVAVHTVPVAGLPSSLSHQGLIRVYWSHFATTPRGGFLKVLSDNCFSPILPRPKLKKASF